MRRIIDVKLNEAGWEADTTWLDYRKGARPEEGVCKAQEYSLDINLESVKEIATTEEVE